MSSITSGIGQVSDLQSQIWQMYNKINNATIDAGQKNSVSAIDDESVSKDFIKSLEEQFQKQNQQVFDEENLFIKDESIGMPAGLNIQEVGEPEKSYQSIIESLTESMTQNSEQNLAGTPDSETTGSLAFLNTGDNIKTQASNFIQKLIDTYKDKGSINGLNV